MVPFSRSTWIPARSKRYLRELIDVNPSGITMESVNPVLWKNWPKVSTNNENDHKLPEIMKEQFEISWLSGYALHRCFVPTTRNSRHSRLDPEPRRRADPPIAVIVLCNLG